MKIIKPIPTKFYLACSGGSDSMFALNFFLKGQKDFAVLFVDHGTEFSKFGKKFVSSKLKGSSTQLLTTSISPDIPKGVSKEAWWHEKRKSIFNSLDLPVVTAHHLNDQMETYIMTTLTGRPDYIPHTNDNVVRPFLLVSKHEIVDWNKRHNVEYLDDPSNNDLRLTRNRVRHKVLPELLKCQPGLEKVVRKKFHDF